MIYLLTAGVCLSAAIGTRLAVFQGMPGWLIVAVVAALVAGLTEFTSNVATSSLLLPILAELVNMSPHSACFTALLSTNQYH